MVSEGPLALPLVCETGLPTNMPCGALIAGASVTCGASANAGEAELTTPSVPSRGTVNLMLRVDKSPPPCGPVRVPTSWLGSAGDQFDHSSSPPCSGRQQAHPRRRHVQNRE